MLQNPLGNYSLGDLFILLSFEDPENTGDNKPLLSWSALPSSYATHTHVQYTYLLSEMLNDNNCPVIALLIVTVLLTVIIVV